MSARAAVIVPTPTRAAFRRSVLGWFGREGRDLPWRRTRDPWRVLVSEVMLQQTQVERVIPKYEAFVRRWPSPAALAASSVGDVLAAWSGLGYNRRAARLREAAIAIVERHGGDMPSDIAALEALPGVGRYTARAVAAFAHDRDVALWDTNIRRIVLRYFLGGEFADGDPGNAELERMLDQALPKGRSRDWHGALMDLGASVCLGRSPRCGSCPLARSCAAGPRFMAGEAAPRALIRPQPRFEGSRRQARGAVIRELAAAGRKGIPEPEAVARLARPDASDVIDALIREGLVVRERGRLSLP
ncbi:MAG TPA: A/G-specific adenine glycosylase [Candidatus Eisenbacteria bacterium]|nr:A/G-specific adenine glycosylase [Candidatus Eisenbacteria bacterium]